ncbi:hypothetical protein BDR26DRAFT_932074 [Obelidium mucronatum]|nr:hypothetical protein BDR26DRAFT_932074 [Obelidium mucronatum]
MLKTPTIQLRQKRRLRLMAVFICVITSVSYFLWYYPVAKFESDRNEDHMSPLQILNKNFGKKDLGNLPLGKLDGGTADLRLERGTELETSPKPASEQLAKDQKLPELFGEKGQVDANPENIVEKHEAGILDADAEADLTVDIDAGIAIDESNNITINESTDSPKENGFNESELIIESGKESKTIEPNDVGADPQLQNHEKKKDIYKDPKAPNSNDNTQSEIEDGDDEVDDTITAEELIKNETKQRLKGVREEDLVWLQGDDEEFSNELRERFEAVMQENKRKKEDVAYMRKKRRNEKRKAKAEKEKALKEKLQAHRDKFRQ